jgi:hypothetical protein
MSSVPNGLQPTGYIPTEAVESGPTSTVLAAAELNSLPHRYSRLSPPLATYSHVGTSPSVTTVEREPVHVTCGGVRTKTPGGSTRLN